MRRSLLALVVCVSLISSRLLAQCGGEERWALKMGADPGAALIDAQSPITTSLNDLVHLLRPTLPSDDVTRTTAERTVRIVDGHLVKFKQETGKTGDSDFHLVISDETLLYSAGGNSSPVSSHSVIAEIPDPNCVAGRNGTVTTASRFQTELSSVRAAFLQQFPNIKSGWNDAGGIPVRVTGVVFFDRAHGQVGRALNGLELHPVLAIQFNPSVTPPAVSLANSDFEAGATGWTVTADVISKDQDQQAHGGQWKAWLGGYGTVHTDRLWQQVALPAGANAVSLTFYMHIETEEETQNAYDKLRVRVRDANGQLLETVKTFSNQHAAAGFTLQSVNLTAYRGRTIRIELEAQEDNGSSTSFVVDDFRIVVNGQ